MQLSGGGSQAIESAHIVDNTIVNDDINAAAEIAYSKLNLANSIASDDMSPDVIKTLVVSISSAQILQAFTTPVEIIPAPGAGKIIIVDDILFKYTHVSTSYVNNSTSAFKYGGTSITFTATIPAAIFTGSANASRLMKDSATSFVTDTCENTSIVWYVNIENFTTGNGTAKIYIKYRIVTL